MPRRQPDRSTSSRSARSDTSRPAALTGRPDRVRSALLVLLGLAAPFVVAACGDDTVGDYGAANEEAFLAACTDGTDDPLYQERVCRCVYEEASQRIPFSRFEEIEDQLGDEEAVLPLELVELLAECAIVEGDL